MNELATTSSMLPVPTPRVASPVQFRLATIADVPQMDALQKRYNKALGYFKTEWFEGYIRMAGVLVAECDGALAGYCISRDQYLKRDELGVIYQLCVVPGEQRKLVGAALVREVFARSAYGCKLYCLWCAQDLDANYFWESMGFLPIAFRAGSKSKARVHIFWQRRIREADTTTPFWFPSKTSGGAIAEDRIVLPIPPGVHWKDPMPVLLPTAGVPEGQKTLPAVEATPGEKSKPRKSQKTPTLMPPTRRGARFGPPPANDVPEPVVETPKPEKAKREPKPKVKADPAIVAKARELRDRYLEHVNNDPAMLLGSAGKYDVSKAIEHTAPPILLPTALLPAA